MKVAGGNGCIEFENLTFNGNVSAVFTYCSDATPPPPYGCNAASGSPGGPINNLEWNELDLQGSNLAGDPEVSFTWVESCYFEGAPGIAIYTNYYSYILGNHFYFASLLSITPSSNHPYISGNSAIWAWINQTGETQPTNIQFNTNLVVGAGGGGTGINGANTVEIQGNYFYANNQNCAGNYGSQLGVVNQTSPISVSNYVEIEGNTIKGPPPTSGAEGPPSGYTYVVTTSSCSGGTELWGTDYTITGNYIENNALGGLVTQDASGVLVSGNYIENNGDTGIFFNTPTGTTCPPAFGSLPGPIPSGLTSPYLFLINGDNQILNNGSYAIEGTANSSCSTDQNPDATTVSVSTNNTITGNGHSNVYPYYN
jgi:hypothetical protein